MPGKYLIIQTAFIGDVVLATSIIENIHAAYPDAEIDFLVRLGNESLLRGHPYIRKVLIWNKKEKKMQHLFRMLKDVRKEKYDKVINVQRYAATGILTAFSGSKEKIGFDKNPFSFTYTKKIKHIISPLSIPIAIGRRGVGPAYRTGRGEVKHELERNHALIKD